VTKLTLFEKSSLESQLGAGIGFAALAKGGCWPYQLARAFTSVREADSRLTRPTSRLPYHQVAEWILPQWFTSTCTRTVDLMITVAPDDSRNTSSESGRQPGGCVPAPIQPLRDDQ
jgi:hypothetical protein